MCYPAKSVSRERSVSAFAFVLQCVVQSSAGIATRGPFPARGPMPSGPPGAQGRGGAVNEQAADRKSVVIVGAGVAGLAAGIYALQSGFKATVFERREAPGGASTGWSREGYAFEGGARWVSGLASGKALNALWREVGALDDDTAVHVPDPYYAFEADGRAALLFRDPKRLREQLSELAPEDASEIKRLCADVAKLAKVDMPLKDVKGVEAKHPVQANPISSLPMAPGFARTSSYAKQSVSVYLKRFKNPFLKRLLASLADGDESALSLANTLAAFAAGDAGRPEGGSIGMVQRMEARFEELGGTLRCSSPVDRVVVEDGSAVGVVAGGEMLPADAVIVTEDTLTAAFSLFDPPLDQPWVRAMLGATKPLLGMLVCLGVAADLKELPESVGFGLPEPLRAAGREYSEIAFSNFARCEGCAPSGCTALTVPLKGDTYDWWLEREADGTYAEAKRRIAEDVIAALEEKFPPLAGKVEAWDVATPLSYERRLLSYKGSWMSVLEPNTSTSPHSAKPQGIERLYFAGQRMMLPGGLPAAVKTARIAVQYLCRDTRTVFQAELD